MQKRKLFEINQTILFNVSFVVTILKNLQIKKISFLPFLIDVKLGHNSMIFAVII